MNKRQLKHLAESYVYSNKQLTTEEFEALKYSEYSDLLKDKTTFTNIYENYLPGDDKDDDRVHTPHHSDPGMFYPGINRGYISKLSDDLQDHFKINILSNDYKIGNFSRLTADDIKEYIKGHCDLHHDSTNSINDCTQEFISRILLNKDVLTLLYALYACAGR